MGVGCGRVRGTGNMDKELGGVERKETMIGMYCMKKVYIFAKKGES